METLKHIFDQSLAGLWWNQAQETPQPISVPVTEPLSDYNLTVYLPLGLVILTSAVLITYQNRKNSTRNTYHPPDFNSIIQLEAQKARTYFPQDLDPQKKITPYNLYTRASMARLRSLDRVAERWNQLPEWIKDIWIGKAADHNQHVKPPANPPSHPRNPSIQSPSFASSKPIVGFLPLDTEDVTVLARHYGGKYRLSH